MYPFYIQSLAKQPNQDLIIFGYRYVSITDIEINERFDLPTQIILFQLY